MEKSLVSHAVKIAIVGVGAVGASFEYSLMIHGYASEIILIDNNKKEGHGEAMDLEHGLPFVLPTKISAGDYSDCKDADTVVLAAGSAQKPAESRLNLVDRNFAIFKEIMPQITQHNNICLSVHSTVNRDGIAQTIKLLMEDTEIRQLQNSASVLKKVIEHIGLG